MTANVYLAAPFFNPAQVELCEFIELMFAGASGTGITLFSPRIGGVNPPAGQSITAEIANEIFRDNMRHLLDATHVLCVLDWKMMPGTELRVVGAKDVRVTDRKTFPSPALNIPDPGTVFEMGVVSGLRMRGKNITVIGYTERGTEESLNVMLSQACYGILPGREALQEYLAGMMNNHLLKPWVGRNQ